LHASFLHRAVDRDLGNDGHGDKIRHGRRREVEKLKVVNKSRQQKLEKQKMNAGKTRLVL